MRTRPAHPDAAHRPAALDLPLKLALARLAHGVSPAAVSLALADWWIHLLVSPSRHAELASSAMRKSLQWSHYAQHGWHGECPRCVEPLPQDRRFAPPEWQAPGPSALAQAFLLQQQWWDEAMTGVRGVSQHHEEVAAFVVRQWLDMASPSNFVATNPQVLRETAATGGLNLANGLANWWRDAVAVLTDGTARGVEDFVPGKQVALTPGKVVFRNRLIELIQYLPQTPKVHAEPLLIVPSWIMKYYILDLTPEDSLVRYLVGQGHTVFMVSWRNPGTEDRALGMDDYLHLGVLDAIAAVRSACPGPLHAAGYCLGGTLLSIAAAALRRSGDSSLKSVTLLAAETDFEQPGELGLFIDESQISFLEDLMAEHGYLDGRQMAGAFQLINSKDLVWSKLVHEYLMGAQTPMTALRAWNADATRLPARMHSEYLRRLYLHNDLAEGRYPVDGEPVTLADIDLPMFVVATERDHVSPWKSVYEVQRLVRAPIAFALSTGGHNVGIVNPPDGAAAHGQTGYRFAVHAAGKAPADPQAWFDAADVHAGSWWPCWEQWLAGQSSGRVAPPPVRALRSQGHELDAPGTYVLQD
ncbi:PHA/PHB synthase family protein [Caenimonas terrae]|uniref:PHA/PHB synthase family protein n=1 Tax=Caenimonas terrae TaxID=696074 RepID=A0ABW0NFJ1_9BURK